MRSRGRWPRAATSARPPRRPRGPCRGAGAGVAACSEPALRSYLNLRCGCRGGGRLNGTQQPGQHAVEKLVDLLRRAADVRGGVQLIRGRLDAKTLEVGCARQALEQRVRGSAIQTMRPNHFVELLAVTARLPPPHQQPLGREVGY